jgi:acyl carrier protein
MAAVGDGGAEISEQEILAYLRDRLFVDVASVDRNTLLITDGVIDSFALIELLTYIEERAQIRFSPADATLENLDSIELILRLVERTRERAA